MAISFLNTGTFSDNSKLKIGSGGDLEIFHDASDTYLENYTGEFIFTQHVNDGDMRFKCDDGSGGTATYMFLDGSAEQIKFNKNTEHQDDVQAQFGTSSDLKIYHSTGASSYIENTSGDLYIMQRTNNGDMYFQCDDGSGGDTTYFFLDGGTSDTNDLVTTFPDYSRLTFGTGRDLKIWHDTANSYISDAGTGILYIQGDNQIRLDNPTSGEKYARFYTDGQVELFYDDSLKFETTSAGVSITGSTTISTIDEVGSDTDKFLMSDSGEVKYVTGSNLRSYIGAGTGSGTVTSVAVTVGTGLDVSGSPITSSGTIDIDLDLSEFTDMTSAMTGTDEFIVLDSSAERRKAANEIGLSIFDNDSGFVTSSGVTSVSATAPITSTGGTTPTIACTTASVTNGSTSLVTGNDVYDFVNGSYLPLDGSSAMEGDLDMDGYDIDNVVNLELNGSAAGAIVLDTALSATSVKGCGTIINFGSTSVTQGSYYYWKSSSAWELTDADTEAKTNGLIAYARFTGTASTGGMLLNGIIHDASHGFTIGAPLYISTSAGTISNTAPSGSGDSVRVVGYAIDSNHIYFCPDNTWVKVS